MIHGQCTSVGVAGYLLGGGINVVGTSERYGSGANHVARYTMVDAQGRILLVRIKKVHNDIRVCVRATSIFDYLRLLLVYTHRVQTEC